MANYAENIKNYSIPQTKKAKDSQVQNNEGGYVFKVDMWTSLNRFLILGSEKGSYYADSSDLTMDNYDNILKCLDNDWQRTINTIVEISSSGRCVKNTTCLFALAVCSVYGNKDAKQLANSKLGEVARFSTALFEWVGYVLTLKEGKKSKGMLRAISSWYTSKTPMQLAYQICKYPSRSVNGKKISHRDLLRMCRPGYKSQNGKKFIIPSKTVGAILSYAVKEDLDVFKELPKDEAIDYIHAHCKAGDKETPVKVISKLVHDFKLTRESIIPDMRNEKEVQEALLKNSPLTAMIRNLGQMTASGCLSPLKDTTQSVIATLRDTEKLRSARIHPMTMFMAWQTYQKGKGVRTSWNPIGELSHALEEAFYKSFSFVNPTGKKFLLGVDVSGSMSWDLDNGISCAQAAAVVAMSIARVETNWHIMGFSDDFVDLGITPSDSLNDVLLKTSSNNFGITDCSVPMEYALSQGLDVDVFVVLTDNETYCGGQHPFVSLQKYRKKMNPNAKSVVMAFEPNNFSVADPSDAGMLDVVGLDSNVIEILQNFSKGEF